MAKSFCNVKSTRLRNSRKVQIALSCFLSSGRFSILILFAFCFQSCASIIYGIHQPQHIVSLRNKEGVLPGLRFTILDTTYKSFLANQFAENQLLKKDLSQPLQFWYFKDGKLEANAINCYASGFPNLKWNILATVENKTIYGVAKSMILTTDDFSKIFRTTLPDKGEIAIVTTAQFMGRQNKRFLKEVAHALAIKKPDTTLLFVMDNTYQ